MRMHPLLAGLAAVGVLPVVELPSADVAAPLVKALIAGGCPVVEITLRSAAGLEALPVIRRSFPDVLIGAGTVRTLADAHRCLAAGAQFIVSPGTNPEIIALCRSLDVPVMPGACTPTEVDAAVTAGATAVKFFPAEAMGGVKTLKALAGPFRDVSFVPTGGIGPANLASYLALPGVPACGGSWLVATGLLAEGRFGQVAELTREAVAIAAKVRAGAA
ncbi:MAG TPA: bifunctional 4-hydroxy-2-oxoglutarate aldolase/2-dehydro-3-deoxy-phosphogluconate aldolase [Streptosporangiaceae bacterium]|nr:bifunctional 4-hydroxy-2-oxoglutarate aldolase/2-dehydro-3-deoxy-phosphogluconate aldolase [Streptosporangiaceae bacterium]